MFDKIGKTAGFLSDDFSSALAILIVTMVEPSQSPTTYYVHREVGTPEEEGEEYMGTIVTPQGVVNFIVVKICMHNNQVGNAQEHIGDIGAQGGPH